MLVVAVAVFAARWRRNWAQLKALKLGREGERAKEEAAQRKQRERRQKDVDKAQSALDAARRSHDRDAAGIQAKIEDLEEQSRAEEARWGKERSKLEAALRRTRG